MEFKRLPDLIHIIDKHELFDAEWYIEKYPDAADFKEGPLQHFLNHGAFENRSPHPLFDLQWYRNFYQLDENVNPLIHFIVNSKKLSYNPNAFFNIEWYAENYMKGSLPYSFQVFEHYYTHGEKDNYLPSENFDPFFYRESYAGSQEFKFGLLSHYIHHGRREKKLPFSLVGKTLHPLCLSLQQLDLNDIIMDKVLDQYFTSQADVKEFFSSCLYFPEDIPVCFQPGNYARYYPDLSFLENNPLQAIKHFLTHGVKENRVYRDLDIIAYKKNFYNIWKISKNELESYHPKLKACVLVHIFYPDLYEELKSYLKNLSEYECDIYFNLVENSWTIDFHQTILADFPKARIIVSQNIGRDIGGFFNLLSYIKNIETYDAFLLVHSKKSPHISESLSSKWRKDLLDGTIGSPEIVLQNIYLMEKYNTGLVGAGLWRHRHIDKNTDKYYYIMKVLEISKKNQHCDYLSGTIMWLNSKVVNYLYSRCKKLQFEDGDDKSLEFHMDGQFAHAIERIFGNICQQLSLNMVFR